MGHDPTTTTITLGGFNRNSFNKVTEALARASADGRRLGEHLLSSPMHPSLLPLPLPPGRLSATGNNSSTALSIQAPNLPPRGPVSAGSMALGGDYSNHDRSSGARRSPGQSPSSASLQLGSGSQFGRYPYSQQQGQGQGQGQDIHSNFPRQSMPSPSVGSGFAAISSGKRSSHGTLSNSQLSDNNAHDIESQIGRVRRHGSKEEEEGEIVPGDSSRSLMKHLNSNFSRTSGWKSVGGSQGGRGSQYQKKPRASHAGPTGGGEGEEGGTPKTIVAQCFQVGRVTLFTPHLSLFLYYQPLSSSHPLLSVALAQITQHVDGEDSPPGRAGGVGGLMAPIAPSITMITYRGTGEEGVHTVSDEADDEEHGGGLNGTPTSAIGAAALIPTVPVKVSVWTLGLFRLKGIQELVKLCQIVPSELEGLLQLHRAFMGAGGPPKMQGSKARCVMSQVERIESIFISLPDVQQLSCSMPYEPNQSPPIQTYESPRGDLARAYSSPTGQGLGLGSGGALGGGPASMRGGSFRTNILRQQQQRPGTYELNNPQEDIIGVRDFGGSSLEPIAEQSIGGARFGSNSQWEGSLDKELNAGDMANLFAPVGSRTLYDSKSLGYVAEEEGEGEVEGGSGSESFDGVFPPFAASPGDSMEPEGARKELPRPPVLDLPDGGAQNPSGAPQPSPYPYPSGAPQPSPYPYPSPNPHRPASPSSFNRGNKSLTLTNLMQIASSSPSGQQGVKPEDLMHIGGPASAGSSGFDRGISHLFEAGRDSGGDSSERGSLGLCSTSDSQGLGGSSAGGSQGLGGSSAGGSRGLGGSSAGGSTPQRPTSTSSLKVMGRAERLESLSEEPNALVASVSSPTRARGRGKGGKGGKGGDVNPFVLGRESSERIPQPPPGTVPEVKGGLTAQGGQSSLVGLESLVHWTSAAGTEQGAAATSSSQVSQAAGDGDGDGDGAGAGGRRETTASSFSLNMLGGSASSRRTSVSEALTLAPKSESTSRKVSNSGDGFNFTSK